MLLVRRCTLLLLVFVFIPEVSKIKVQMFAIGPARLIQLSHTTLISVPMVVCILVFLKLVIVPMATQFVVCIIDCFA